MTETEDLTTRHSLDRPTSAEPPGTAHVVAHHLLVGAAVTLPWVASVAVLPDDVPVVLPLLLVVGTALPVVSVVVVRRGLARERIRGRAAAFERLGLTRPSWRTVVRDGLPALAASALLPGVVVALEQPLRAALGAPARWSTGWPPDLDGASTVLLALGWVAVAVLIGPICEEVVFRGMLQPLCASTPARRILLGSALFAVYHLWQPWTWATVLVATLPVAWVRERSGSTVLAVAVHVLVNAAAAAVLISGASSR